jgi:hypothetical protein
MSDVVTATVQGVEATKKAFAVAPEVFRERLNVATDLTLREIVRAAQGRVLASPAIRTRSLYNAIGFTLNKKTGRGRAGVQNLQTRLALGGRARVRFRGRIVTFKNRELVVNPRRYAHLIEFGTRRAPAEPFMRPAAQAQTEPFVARCQQAMREAERGLAANVGGRTL